MGTSLNPSVQGSSRRDPEKVVSIAFCSDAHMEVALHVAASSVVKSLDRNCFPRIYLLLSEFPTDGIERLRKTLDRVGRPYELVVLTPDVQAFRGLRPFHGSLAAYFRLLLPDLVTEKRFLYLDLDTVTFANVYPLFELDMEGHAMGFVVGGTVEHALERKFLLKQGLSITDPSFNSGVMLVDTAEWKSQSCFSRILSFCREYPADLVAADQTALNVLFANDCLHLERRFNVELSTVSRAASLPADSIFHFVGSPKPWDLLGRAFHPYFGLWSRALRDVALSPMQKNPYLKLSSWWRLPKILGGYRRILRQRREAA